MAVESKRGCGYRQAGGTYLVGGGIGVPCDRLPYEIHECPCCHHAITKQTRSGLQWLNIGEYVQGPHILAGRRCLESTDQSCSFCAAPELMGEVLVHWVGEEFYPTPLDFISEGVNQGFSRRIKAVPQGFKLGETYVFLAHPKAVSKWVDVAPEEASKLFGMDASAEAKEEKYFPGFFYIWKPQRIEKIFDESQRGSEEVAATEKRGITPVFVPDNDPDHHSKPRGKKAPKAEDGTLAFEEN